MGQIGQHRRTPSRLIDRFADMAVEVAIGAFGHAERPMHVQCERGDGGFHIWGLERVTGIEPVYSAWKAAVLPLYYTRLAP